MTSKMKNYQRNAETYERRWKNAYEQGVTSEMYAATRDYEKNIKAQEEELKQMDPNSRDYQKAHKSIEEQKATQHEMVREQKYQSYGEPKHRAYEHLEAKNTQLSHDMAKAIERGDTENYQRLRDQYQKNIETQDQLGREMREEGTKYVDTGRQSKQDILCKDHDMAEKLEAKVAEREAKGKNVKEEDRAAAEKFRAQAQQTKADTMKYNGDRTVESMREKGESEQKIKEQEEQNKKDLQNIHRY